MNRTLVVTGKWLSGGSAVHQESFKPLTKVHVYIFHNSAYTLKLSTSTNVSRTYVFFWQNQSVLYSWAEDKANLKEVYKLSAWLEKFGRRHFEIFVLVFPEKKPGYRGLICGFLCLRFYLFRVIFQCWDTENMFVIVALSELNPPYSSKIDIFIQESFNKLIYGIHNTKTCLFKYIENFTSKNWNFSDKIFRYFSYFCSKHRLWVLVRTASARRF